MEVQVIYQSVSGVMRQQAVLSFLVQAQAGETNSFFSKFNLFAIPNMSATQSTLFYEGSFNVATMMYPEKTVASGVPPFNYYKYMGSMTSPPCEEYVVHFVVQKPILLSSTIVSSIREALDYPDDFEI